MHRGVREFIRWVQTHEAEPNVRVMRAATTRELNAIQHEIGTPLPADLRMVLSVFGGGALPNGVMLSVQPGPGETIGAVLRQIATERKASFFDPEVLLPFFRNEQGSILAFDRTAAPVQDTWPIVDLDLQTGEVCLIHRTFDGWCRLCLADWTSPDFQDEFSIDKYLAQAERHVTIEPDVSIAHLTVAHALRRAGQPERALSSYLAAARCVPAVPRADWEALKLAVLLGRPREALEVGARLVRRAPPEVWDERGTTPSRTASALASLTLGISDSARAAVLRLIDPLVAQGLDDRDRAALQAIRRAITRGERLPPPHPAPDADVWPAGVSVASVWPKLQAAYREGRLRDDHLVLDPRFGQLEAPYEPVALLRLRRDFV